MFLGAFQEFWMSRNYITSKTYLKHTGVETIHKTKEDKVGLVHYIVQ